MGAKALSLNPARVYLIMGARGTGKSHFLRLLRPLFPKALFFDLDQEMEKLCGASASALFLKGEPFFRKKEQEAFDQIIKKLPKNQLCFIALGAGFVLKKKPFQHVIWLCRGSDEGGRVFFNRPRLTSDKSPYREYKKLYEKRKAFYAKQADECLLRREHFKELEDSDKAFWGLKTVLQRRFSLRLDPKALPKDPARLNFFLQKRLLHWGIRFFEINDETADLAFLRKMRSLIPEDRLLLSLRVSGKWAQKIQIKNLCWDLSLGPPPSSAGILSLHERGQKSLPSLLRDLSRYKKRRLKLAVEILNLQELKTAYDWWRQDPLRRSFLPRSKRGRWLWFRQLFGPQMWLNFIRERPGEGGVLDQPFFSQALPFAGQAASLGAVSASKAFDAVSASKAFGAMDTSESFSAMDTSKSFDDEPAIKSTGAKALSSVKQKPFKEPESCFLGAKKNKWDQDFLSLSCKGANPVDPKEGFLAGVLGDPIAHSATPFEQGQRFFNQRGIPVAALPLREEEMTKPHLDILRSFGFVFFAVTSPLKRRAFLCAKIKDKKAMELGVVNTLIWDGRVWQGFNTDEEGFRSLRAYSSPDTAVWGGGGVRPVLQKLMPKARFYSARSGKPLAPKDFILPEPGRCLKPGDTMVCAAQPQEESLLREDRMKGPVFGKERRLKSFGPEGRDLPSAKTQFAGDSQKAEPLGAQKEAVPQIVVWALSRSRIDEGALMPPKEWRPRHVIDLDYTEDSPGREYALQTGAKYTGGQLFFEKQAQGQRRILRTFKMFSNSLNDKA